VSTANVNVNAAAASAASFVDCEKHGNVPGYVVCSCVLLFGKPIAHLEKPTKLSLGEIMCERLGRHEVHEYRLLCARCAPELGLDRKGARRSR
jgi:hypothetical protein